MRRVVVANPSFLPFRPGAPASEIRRIRAIRSSIHKIQEEFRDIRERHKLPEYWYQSLDKTIENLRYFSRLTDPHLEEMILISIETQNLVLIGELEEYLSLPRGLIVEVLDRLEARGTVYQVDRYVPGSGRQYRMYKSRRVKNVEVYESFADHIQPNRL